MLHNTSYVVLGIIADTSFESSHALDGLVIIFSTIFIILSGRSLINTLYLAYRITRFLMPRMKNFHLKILKPLFSIWHIMVVLSNILAVVGSILKLLLSNNVSCMAFYIQACMYNIIIIIIVVVLTGNK